MAVTNVNKQEFETLTKEGVVLVDFYADWCGPCKMLAPMLDTLSSQREDVKVLKVNVDTEGELAQSFGIMSVPTLLLYKDGEVVSKKSGFHTVDMLNEWINSVI